MATRKSINSCRKGKNGERAFAAWLCENLGVAARRGCQFKGGADSPDVVGVDGVHFEVKRVESLNLWRALEQAKRDSGGGVPVVAAKRNHGPWVLILEASRLREACKIFAALCEQKEFVEVGEPDPLD